MTRLLVLGGNAAGMSAAAKAKRRAPALEVEVIEAGPDVAYSMCGLPAAVEGRVKDPDDLVLSRDEAARRGITVRTETRALAFNPYTKEVVLEERRGGKTARDSAHYDRLLVATGARARNPFGGKELAGVHALRHLEEGRRLLVQAKSSKRLAVVGAGPLGLEMACAFAARGAHVELLTRGSRLLPSMDADVTDGLADWLASAGVKVHLKAGVERFAPGKAEGKVGKVEAKSGDVAADTVLVAVGIEPATELATKAGVTTTKEGHVLADDNMRTNLHDVWAAGDCVAARHIVTGRPTPMAFSLPASRMGRVAGDAIGASTEKIPGPCMYFPGVLGTAVTHLFGLAFAQTGVTEQVAKAEGLDHVAVLVEAKDKAPYLPDAADMAVKMVAERGSGKLLGVQLAGPAESALRIDAAALAVQNGLKVQKLAETETAYHPHFSPVYDPLLVAATQCAKLARK